VRLVCQIRRADIISGRGIVEVAIVVFYGSRLDPTAGTTVRMKIQLTTVVKKATYVA
jgi:hypothetical protein